MAPAFVRNCTTIVLKFIIQHKKDSREKQKPVPGDLMSDYLTLTGKMILSIG